MAGTTKKKRKKKKKKPINPRIAWLVVVVGGLLSLIVLLEAIFRARDSSLVEWLSGGEESRMAEFAEVAGTERLNLLYLTYLDSLARYGRLLPDEDEKERRNVVHLLMERAGIPQESAEKWGLHPPAEEGHGELNVIFREMYRKGRIALPMEGASLWTHVRDRKVHPGYIAFGKTIRARGDQIDFCAVVTAVNWLQPEYTAVLYRHPRTGDLVHGSVKEMPQIAYYGSGRPGNDLAEVYNRRLRTGLNNMRDKRPLFPSSR